MAIQEELKEDLFKDIILLLDKDERLLCNYFKKNKCYKRSGLVFTFTISGISIYYFKLYNYYYYFPLIIYLNAFILFVNFPILVIHNSIRPVYFGHDLFLDRERLPYLKLNHEDKVLFLNRIKWVLIILFSLLIGILSDYWLIKAKKSDTLVEMIGVSGGILKIFQIVTQILTSHLLIKAQKSAYNKSIINNREIEII